MAQMPVRQPHDAAAAMRRRIFCLRGVALPHSLSSAPPSARVGAQQGVVGRCTGHYTVGKFCTRGRLEEENSHGCGTRTALPTRGVLLLLLLLLVLLLPLLRQTHYYRAGWVGNFAPEDGWRRRTVMGVGHAQLCQRVAASGSTWPRVAPSVHDDSMTRTPPATLRTDYQLTLSANNPPIISRGYVLEW